MADTKVKMFRIATNGKEHSARDIFKKEPGLGNVLPNNCGENKLGHVALEALANLVETQDWETVRWLFAKFGDGGASRRMAAFEAAVKIANSKAPAIEAPAKATPKATPATA